MADVVMRSTQPALAAIKLAWWRDRLAELDEGVLPAEPRLQIVANELLPRGVRGSALAELECGWASLLEERPDAARVAERGALLFAIGARLLDVDYSDETLGVAGRLYARADAVRRGVLDRTMIRATPVSRIPRRARPLTALAALAVRDLKRSRTPLEPEATPGRAWTLLRHRLTGRL